MEGEAFTIHVDGARHVATIRLARPDDGNRVTTDEIRGLGRAIRDAGSRNNVKLVLLRAGGEHFCLGRQGGPGGDATALDVRSGLAEPILGLYADVRATPVPVLAVVQGAAKGFGCALVGQCDLAIAAEPARFSLPEMDHNIPPTLAMSALLGKLPPKRLAQMVYTRFELSADEALGVGLVSEVVRLPELDAAVNRTLARILDRDRAALCAVKEYMLSAAHLDAASSARLGANIISAVLSSARPG